MSRRAAAAGIQLQQEPPAGTRQTHAGWLRSCSLAGVSKQASAHFNPCLCAVRMLPFVVQTGFFAKGRKGKDKINQTLMENPLRKPSARAGAAVRARPAPCGTPSTNPSAVRAAEPYWGPYWAGLVGVPQHCPIPVAPCCPPGGTTSRRKNSQVLRQPKSPNSHCISPWLAVCLLWGHEDP